MEEQHNENKRQFTRVFPKIDVLVECAERQQIHGQTTDVCMSGMYMRCPGSLPPQTVCRATLLLSGTTDQIQVNGRIVRSDSTGMALVFTEILGLESYEHLRNLLLHNAEMTTDIERELQSHIGLKRIGESA